MATKKPPRGHELSVNQANAVVLDAQGHKRGEIARMTGVSERMITEYRDDPAYRQQLARLQERGVAELESFVARAREKLLRRADDAVDVLGEMLHQTLPGNGEPDLDTRFNAARLLLAHANQVGLKTPEAPAQAVAAAAVVVVRDERPRPAVVEGTARDA